MGKWKGKALRTQRKNAAAAKRATKKRHEAMDKARLRLRKKTWGF